MNKHFEDAWYYLRRAAEHAKLGLEEELEPFAEQVEEIRGEPEPEPEPASRVEKIQQDLKAIEEKAQGQTRERITEARQKVDAYRKAGGKSRT